jgi:DNA polymerase
MNPIAYCMHPETEIISMAAAFGMNGETQVIFGEDNIKNICSRIDWSDKFVIAHNNEGFDSMILAWRLGIRPAMWGCTLAMSRPIHAKEAGGSLAKLAAHYDIGVKDSTALVNTKGKHLKDFTPDEIEAMKEYNKEDVEICRRLFKKLIKVTSKDELRLIDMTIRMLVEPKFEVDRKLLVDTLADERRRKLQALVELGDMLGTDEPEDVRAMLASAPKFAKLLESRGVETPMKVSPTNPDKMTPALAKTDEAFLALQDHPDPVVATAAQTRLGVKSTILETRIQAFLDAAGAAGGKLPVPLKYAGADTTCRWSGWGYNPQNLPRVSKDDKPTNALRMCMRAPKGYKVVVADLSGIELRVNHFLWQVPSSMALFQADPEKADLYKDFASKMYNKPKEEVTKDERQYAKACIAEGELVLTDHGLVPIEKVLTCMQVWDGVEWVNHDGPIFQGEQEVITYGSLTATPDHIVYLRDGSSCRFDKAAAENLEIARTGYGGEAVRVGGGHIQRAGAEEQAALRSGSMHELPTDKSYRAPQLETRGNQRVSTVQQPEAHTEVVGSEGDRDETALHEPERQSVPELRGARSGVSIPFCAGCGPVDSGEPWAAQGAGTGQGRQQRALRTREPAVGDRPDANYEPPEHDGEGEDVLRTACSPPGGEVCGHNGEKLAEDPDSRTDRGPVAQPTVGQTKRRVWDLLNAGPRHRFTVAGLLVSNCQLGLGFGAGSATFVKVAKLMGGIDLTLDDANDVVGKWREAYPEIVAGWKSCHAVLPIIAAGQDGHPIDPWGLCVPCAEGIRVPLGLIRYPDLRREVVDEMGKKEWMYGQGRHKARIYAGKITEILEQRLARDVIAGNALAVLRGTGYSPALMVHDELVYIAPESEAQELLDFVQCTMRTPPSWWPELVTWSEGDIADTYGEAK